MSNEQNIIESALDNASGINAGNRLREAILNEEPDGVLIPSTHQIKSFEHLLPNPYFFRAVLNTTSVTDFIQYVEKQIASEAAKPTDIGVFIDKTTMTAKAIIDMGTHDSPLWGRHKISLKIPKTPEWELAEVRKNTGIRQDDFINLILDFGDSLSFFSETADFIESGEYEQISPKTALQLFRRLQATDIQRLEGSVADTDKTASAFASTSIRSGEAKPITKIVLHNSLFEDLPSTDTTLLLTYEKTDKGIFIKYRIQQYAQHIEERAQAFKNLIYGALVHDAISVFIANIDYQ